ncbi:MAG TPA: phosphatidylglycerol lysyltransferase domain-containing protein [Bacteroidales bacterium]|nr:phosphatidylglycerol lysyltransferase domain-containing protein [Bacteroidales bacterium]
MDKTSSGTGLVRSVLAGWLSPVKENSRIIAQFLLALIFIAVGAWFFKHEQPELGKTRDILGSVGAGLVSLGIFLTFVYITLQGLMYKMAFASVRKEVSITKTIVLFLKRNLISIFMPAGGIASLAFFTDDIEKEERAKTKIHLASTIYAFVGMLTVVTVAIPVIIYTMIEGLTGTDETLGLAGMILWIIILYLLFRSLMKKKLLYRLVIRFFPSSVDILEEMISRNISTSFFLLTILVSIIIDITGILHLYIAMAALGAKASLLYAALGYLTGVLSLSVSPFMRGLGAVEISMSFVLTRLGYQNADAVAITLLYRFFEFWLPLISGVVTFLSKFNRLLMRVVPALLIFLLGITNVVSAMTPAIHARIRLLEEFIPFDAIAASNFFILVAGAFMLLTAVFMLKGLRSAWWIALILSVLSCIGHLTKAIDYEEAILALVVIAVLLLSGKQYIVRGNPRLHIIGIRTAVLSIAAVIIYGSVGFYFLDKKHFGIGFNFWQSIGFTLRNFVLLGNAGLNSHSHFARYFILSINISGLGSLSFLAYTLLRPFIYKGTTSPEDREKAERLVNNYGKSSLDYFKTYNDKLIFSPRELDAFISYRTTGNFAVVLEDPVAVDQDSMDKCIAMFDEFCFANGLRNIYFRVPEESLPIYSKHSKKSLFVGQEGVVDLGTFTLEGGKNKALRNAVNKVKDEGYRSSVHQPPIRDGLMQKLKSVSDEWLLSTGRHEIVFSQGMFLWNELKNQTILTVENPEEKVIAFANIIPDFVAGECTYDLMRKANDAPHGVLDFLMIEMLGYLKSKGCTGTNLGFAPMSGIKDPHTFQERTLKFAYEKIRSFSHYKGLRFFKEKYSPVWHNKYLIYSDDYDLLQIPAALARVIKP